MVRLTTGLMGRGLNIWYTSGNELKNDDEDVESDGTSGAREMKRLRFCGMTAAGFAAACLLSAAAFAGEARTKVLFLFDTEDYTCDRSNDAIRDIANILTEEGVRGNFNIVGFLGLRIAELGRMDVVEALRPHVLGTQTLYHSRHPDIAELGDNPDYERAYRLTMRDEARGVGMLEAAFGEGRVVFACPPGNSVSAVAFDVYSDLGIVLNAGTGFYGHASAQGVYGGGLLVRKGKSVGGLWYFNQYHLPYYHDFALEYLIPRLKERTPDVKAVLDGMADFDIATIYMHPHMAVKTAHWDGPNYRYGNNCEWRKWIQVEDRPKADTDEFYRRLRMFVRAVKSDARFEVTDIEAMLKSFAPRRRIAPSDVPAIRRALGKALKPLREPASWSVADCFQAAVRLLRGEETCHPGKVYGFRSRPRGVVGPVVVRADDLRAAAAGIDLTTFLPASIPVGGETIGPADFLMAALEVLETNSEEVKIVPREQLGSFEDVPSLETMNISGSWVHTKEFKDRYLSERLRLQLWTMRFE